MEDFYEIMRYLPTSYKSEQDEEYIAYLRDSFEQNYQSGKYQFALLASHMLYMSFVYFSVWQIKNSQPADFANALVGFKTDEEKKLLEASGPFAFAKIGETRFFRFLKLAGCENGAVDQYAELVQKRNKMAHPNGVIHCTDRKTADERLGEVLAQMDAIQQCMTAIIHKCMADFLVNTACEDASKIDLYLSTEDQIREALIHANYFSEKDIQACLNFDIHQFHDHANYADIAGLFSEFKALYEEEA